MEKEYQHAVWNPISSYVISDKQIAALYSCAWYITSHKALKEKLPDWDCDKLGDDLDEFIAFIQAEVETANQAESQLLVSRFLQINEPPLLVPYHQDRLKKHRTQ